MQAEQKMKIEKIPKIKKGKDHGNKKMKFPMKREKRKENQNENRIENRIEKANSKEEENTNRKIIKMKET
jgi:hypothetical protein